MLTKTLNFWKQKFLVSFTRNQRNRILLKTDTKRKPQYTFWGYFSYKFVQIIFKFIQIISTFVQI